MFPKANNYFLLSQVSLPEQALDFRGVTFFTVVTVQRRSTFWPTQAGSRKVFKEGNQRTNKRRQEERDEAAAALSKMFEIRPSPSARLLCTLPNALLGI